MPWGSGAGTSGLYVTTFIELLKQTATTGALSLATATHKIALHSNSLTGPGTAPINFDAASPNWANTNEVSGTNWAAGGLTFTAAGMGTPTLTISPAGSLMYDAADVSVASTTLATGVRGCILYADPVTAPAGLIDAMIVAVNFGQDYMTNNGTFGVQWATTGIAAIDMTP